MAENTNPTEALAMTIAEETTKTKKEVAGNTKSDEKVNQVKNYASIVSIITFVLSVLILASAIWLLYMKDYDCEELLWLPRLQIGIGIGLIFVSLISNIAVFLRSRFPVPGFFLVMVPLIVMLTMGLALVGANKLESRRLMATPKWFREKVRHNDNWENIKSCIYNTGTCDDLVSRSLNLKAFDFSRMLQTTINMSNGTWFCESNGKQMEESWRPTYLDGLTSYYCSSIIIRYGYVGALQLMKIKTANYLSVPTISRKRGVFLIV
ncbi:hypothetical protein POTOM_023607 [Populus tomentosa]|uniref:Uncharacterized protein n=1 Tax=Populus tomentosa TaxID=118781 RepID=A0A8X7ZIZ6_POPTO|nr:hypothetical protein POTOM_023607 [Populus tomentosa]